MLDRLRSTLEGTFESVGRFFARTGLSPTAWTLVGVAVSFLAALFYSRSHYAGELAGGVLVLVAGGFDIVDGAVARATGQASKRGAFLDSNLDRVAEVAVYVGILLGGYASPLAVLVALSLSLLVSYARARGESLGVRLAGVGIGERSERLLVLAVASLAGVAGWGVLVVAVIAGFTFLERGYRALRALGPGERPKRISTEPETAPQ